MDLTAPDYDLQFDSLATQDLLCEGLTLDDSYENRVAELNTQLVAEGHPALPSFKWFTSKIKNALTRFTTVGPKEITPIVDIRRAWFDLSSPTMDPQDRQYMTFTNCDPTDPDGGIGMMLRHDPTNDLTLYSHKGDTSQETYNSPRPLLSLGHNDTYTDTFFMRLLMNIPTETAGTNLVMDSEGYLCEDVSALKFKEDVVDWVPDPKVLLDIPLKEWKLKSNGKVGYGLVADDVVAEIPEAAVLRSHPCTCQETPNSEGPCENPDCDWSGPSLQAYNKDMILWLLLKDYQDRNAN